MWRCCRHATIHFLSKGHQCRLIFSPRCLGWAIDPFSLDFVLLTGQLWKLPEACSSEATCEGSNPGKGLLTILACTRLLASGETLEERLA